MLLFLITFFVVCGTCTDILPSYCVSSYVLGAATQDGALRGFGQAQCIPKRDYSLADLKLNRIDGEGLLSPKDRTLTQPLPTE